MAQSVSSFFFSALLILACFSVGQGRPCYTRCRFRFCPIRVAFRIGIASDKAFPPRICSKGGFLVGHVDETGQAIFLIRRRFIPISRFTARGLRQRFSPSFFKSYTIRRTKFSGIGHEVPQQNQANYLNGKCVIVPLRAYQVLDSKGNVIANRHPRRPLRDCVAFRVFV